MTNSRSFLGFVLVILTISSRRTGATDDDGIYKIGVGCGDITGPPAGVVLNGYVNPLTHAAGIYTRQYARAFVVQSVSTGNTVTYVTCDMGMIDHTIKEQVVIRLAAKYGNETFNEKNVMISATHTHSGVSGFMTYYAYLIIESYGFNPITFWAAVDGITDAISQAADSLVLGRLSWNRGELLGGNGNRATEAYNNNPQSERDAYKDNVDKDMVLLKMVAVEDDRPMGAFTWWPVHPISFNGGSNPLVSSDSKGYAAILFDYEMNPNARPGKGKFISGFGSSNLGDVSPRYEGSAETPEVKLNFTDDIAGARRLGERQFYKARELFNDAAALQPISGPILFSHTWVDTATVSVDYVNETSGETIADMGLCSPTLGYAYLGLEPELWELWEIIRDFIKAPSNESIECQKPKQVALAAGEMDIPWEWAPSVFSLQIFQIGTFDVVSLPGEYTTMAGRRVRNAVFNVTGHEVVLAGLANNYINYIATPEEYDVQEYEGGATIYGRNTAPVTSTILKQMSEALQNGLPFPEGQAPESFLDKVRDNIDLWVDPDPINGGNFGDLIVDVEPVQARGNEVIVVFNGGSPRNSPLRGGTFLSVEKRNDATGGWTVVRTDADVDTLFHWSAFNRRIEVQWMIPSMIELGSYRIKHFGYYRKAEDGPLIPYIGSSSVFRIE